MSVMAILRWLAACAVALSATARAAGDRFVEIEPPTDEVATSVGPLRLTRSRGVEGAFDIRLEGRAISTVQGTAAEITHVYPDPGAAQLVLVSIASGGTACQLSYEVIEIRPEGVPVVTPAFGNCNGLRSIRKSRAGWLFDLNGNASGTRQTWAYRNGKIRQLGVKRTRRRR